MALSVRPAIPASQVVNIVPSVLAAGGNALIMNGLILTLNTRVPIGTVYTFADATDVSDFFGATSQESALAAIYFLGPNNSTAQPGTILFTQYPKAAVSAYLWGGNVSGLSLSALQALSGTLDITINGSPVTGSVNLSAATSFSNAAEIIGNDLGIEGVETSTVTASVGGTFTCTSSGTTLTVSAVLTGTLQVGDVVSGTDGTNSLPSSDKILSQLTGTSGGVGTYQLSAAATPSGLGSCTVTSLSTTLDVTVILTGSLSTGDVISGIGITSGTYITGQISGTIGGVGFYSISTGATHGASETITAYVPGVYYDSTSGAFVVNSSTTGSASTMSFATGTLATSLMLTQATGAYLSQGAALTTPAAFMPTITAQTQNWCSFMTTWEPADTDKEGFATWTNSQGNRYVYEMWSTNILDTEAEGPSPPVAFINNGNLSGIEMIWDDPTIDTVGGELAAFAMGWTASLDFTRTNGRQTAAFKGQSGLQVQVTNPTAADYLKSYGVNYYGDYTTANQAFDWWYPGSISGPFLWKDTYVDQIYLNQALQLAIMEGLQNTPSIPYNLAGAALIESFIQDPVNAAVNFGSIVAGVELSAAQIAEINNQAGLNIATQIQVRGWYIQVLPAVAQVRAGRTSPPCTLWWCDGGAVQQIVLASITVQ